MMWRENVAALMCRSLCVYMVSIIFAWHYFQWLDLLPPTCPPVGCQQDGELSQTDIVNETYMNIDVGNMKKRLTYCLEVKQLLIKPNISLEPFTIKVFSAIKAK